MSTPATWYANACGILWGVGIQCWGIWHSRPTPNKSWANSCGILCRHLWQYANIRHNISADACWRMPRALAANARGLSQEPYLRDTLKSYSWEPLLRASVAKLSQDVPALCSGSQPLAKDSLQSLQRFVHAVAVQKHAHTWEVSSKNNFSKDK